MIGENYINLDKYEIISARDAHLYGDDVTEMEREMAENIYRMENSKGWTDFIWDMVISIALILILIGLLVYDWDSVLHFISNSEWEDIAGFLIYCILILVLPVKFVLSLLRFLKKQKIRKDYRVFSGKYLQKTVEHHSDDETGETRVWYEHYLTVEVAPNQVMEKIYCNKEISDTLKRGDRLVMMYYKDGSVFVIKKGLPTE